MTVHVPCNFALSSSGFLSSAASGRATTSRVNRYFITSRLLDTIQCPLIHRPPLLLLPLQRDNCMRCFEAVGTTFSFIPGAIEFQGVAVELVDHLQVEVAAVHGEVDLRRFLRGVELESSRIRAVWQFCSHLVPVERKAFHRELARIHILAALFE